MSEQTPVILDEVKDVAYITLNRADKSNAFNGEVIELFNSHLQTVQKNKKIKILVVQANGKHFSAGADLKWMKESINLSADENRADIEKLATLLKNLFSIDIPTIGVIQGACYGGALGIISALDIVYADLDTSFCFSEVKLGLVPGVISPYVNYVMGTRQMQYLFLTAKKFGTCKARELGLVHEVFSGSEMEKNQKELIDTLLSNDLAAMCEVKKLGRKLYASKLDAEIFDYSANAIAKIRQTVSAQERLNNFFSKK